jgi:hypothetical protein
VARRIHKSRGTVARTAGAVAGAMAASVGLLPLAPVLGLASTAGRLRTALELGMRPLGEWDLVLAGAGMHRWLLLASVLPALGLTLLAFANSRVRPFIGGIALGTAALLAQLTWSGDAAFIGGPMLARVWMVANALVCLWLARTALDAKRA